MGRWQSASNLARVLRPLCCGRHPITVDWGIETELLTPAKVVAKVSFVNGDAILGGLSHAERVGGRLGAIMRERAQARGVLTELDNTEVTGLTVSRLLFGRPRIRAVVTACDRGKAGGDLAAMAGATILLTPACTRWPIWPDDLLHRTGNEIGYRSCATWTRSCTSGRATRRWRSVPTSIAPSWCVPCWRSCCMCCRSSSWRFDEAPQPETPKIHGDGGLDALAAVEADLAEGD